MKGIISVGFLLIAIMILCSDANAQTKKKIGLEEGSNSVEVKGRITGNQYVLYQIWVDKGDKWEASLDSTDAYIGYTVKAPNGDRYDFLEDPETSGFYTIRVELNAAGAKNKKPANYTLKVKFEMEPSGPIT